MVRAGLNMIVVTNLSVKTKIINTLFIFLRALMIKMLSIKKLFNRY